MSPLSRPISPLRKSCAWVATLLLTGGFAASAEPAAPVVAEIANSSSEKVPPLEARGSEESKTAALAGQERSHIKLDFIPVEERANRTRRGFPSVTAPKGAYGVEAHGSPKSVFCRTGEPMSAKDLAEWIRNDSRYENGMTVYLLCCETGKGNRCFAQKLADTLGTEVVAPTEKLWPQKNGLYVVAQERTHRSFGIFETREQRADETRPGAMKSFKPSATLVELVSFRRDEDNASESSSSSSAASVASPQQPPRKPLLRASAKTAALLAGIQGQKDSAMYLNSGSR